MARVRLMTYNVHCCVGVGGEDSLDDVASVCAEAKPDILALQELDAPDHDDVGEAFDGVHHARELARRLSMNELFCRTFKKSVGYYGHALLSRFPLKLVKTTTFPSHDARAEPRGAIWARIDLGFTEMDVISTHLGVSRAERSAQSTELMSKQWLGSDDLRRPSVLCGDFNAVPYARTYRKIASRLRDAQRAIARHRPLATFPSRLPFLRLDHVFVSSDVHVRAARVPYNRRSRRASDHLPLVVDIEF